MGLKISGCGDGAVPYQNVQEMMGRVSVCDGMWLWLWLWLRLALRTGRYQSYAADRGFVPSSAELPTYFDSKPNGRNAVSGRSRCLCVPEVLAGLCSLGDGQGRVGSEGARLVTIGGRE